LAHTLLQHPWSVVLHNSESEVHTVETGRLPLEQL
jgi:hypothetical protein